jgi:hypothetical protein
MYCLVTNSLPYDMEIFDDGPGENVVGHAKMQEIRDKVCAAEVVFGRDWEQMEQAQDFCKALLELDPDRRPCAKLALEHPWMAKFAEAQESKEMHDATRTKPEQPLSNPGCTIQETKKMHGAARTEADQPLSNSSTIQETKKMDDATTTKADQPLRIPGAIQETKKMDEATAIKADQPLSIPGTIQETKKMDEATRTEADQPLRNPGAIEETKKMDDPFLSGASGPAAEASPAGATRGRFVGPAQAPRSIGAELDFPAHCWDVEEPRQQRGKCAHPLFQSVKPRGKSFGARRYTVH